MLTWSVVLALTVGIYGQRALGMVLLDTNRVPDRWQAVLERVPLAVITAVVALQTLTTSGAITIDARLAGLLAAAVCAWRRLPLFATVILAAAATALTRSLS